MKIIYRSKMSNRTSNIQVQQSRTICWTIPLLSKSNFISNTKNFSTLQKKRQKCTLKKPKRKKIGSITRSLKTRLKFNIEFIRRRSLSKKKTNLASIIVYVEEEVFGNSDGIFLSFYLQFTMRLQSL